MLRRGPVRCGSCCLLRWYCPSLWRGPLLSITALPRPGAWLQHEANPESADIKETATLLYQTCLLESGGLQSCVVPRGAQVESGATR